MLERSLGEWFGDSKVVDPDGRPLLVYHGTKATFDTFEVPAWFTPSWQMADGFSAELGDGTRTAESKVLSVYLRIENPLFTDDWSVTEGEALCSKWRAKQMAAGHDGVIFTSDTGEVEYIVFRTDQVLFAAEVEREASTTRQRGA